MEPNELKLEMNRTNDDRMNLMKGKGEDYSDDTDTLANFKRMWSVCGILDIDPRRSAGDCARFLMMLKVDRWCNLVKSNKEPANESVRDTVLDMHNYIDLAYASDCEQVSADLTDE